MKMVKHDGTNTSKIYDCESGETLFDGDYDDIPSELMDEEVCSFDVPSEIGKITINISKEG